MNTALVVLAGLLVFAASGSAIAKFLKVPAVVDSMTSVGVKPNQIPLLAVLELAGSAGVVLGIWIQPLGALAAGCLALYFLGAVVSHFRKKHGVAEFAPALLVLLVALATTALEIQR